MAYRNTTFWLYSMFCISQLCHASEESGISGTLFGKTFFRPRSVSVNAARDLIGTHKFINKYHANNEFYGALTITPEYSQAYKTYEIAESLFSQNTLSISGSLVPHRSINNLLADYFGLSPAFQSNVILKPVFTNTIIDFAFYGGWGPFYIHAHTPYVSTLR